LAAITSPAPAVLASPAEFCRLPAAEIASLVRAGGRAPATPERRAWALVMLGRPRTCIPGLLCYALGHSYTGAPFSWRVVVGSVLGFLVGFAANLHNSCTDIEEDSRNLPGRVYLMAQVGLPTLRRSLTVISVFMVGAAALLELHLLAFVLLAAIGMHQYSSPPSRAKDRPVLGLWVFSQAVVFPFLFGWGTEPERMLRALLGWLSAIVIGEQVPPTQTLLQAQRYLGMLVFLTLWFMAKGAVKNVPDYYGDRAAGLRTSATAFATWRQAARVAAAATVAAYLSLGVLVWLGLERPSLLLALLWLVPVAWNCRRLLLADDGSRGNACLKADMLLSSGFIGTVLLLVAPVPVSVAAILVGALVLFLSDRFAIDSRRAQDVPAAPPR
jgi:4-hydroxybenzoate polyprenyltransferase